MSKQIYDALSVDGLKDILHQVSETCKELEIDFFIVGAIARNIWYVSNNEKARGTKDIDFGIYVPNEARYNLLRKKLKEDYNYRVSQENAFCLIAPDGNQVDLLPFGGIEKEGQVIIEGKGLTTLNLHGFKEVYDLGVIEKNIGNETYKTCSIPGIMILKLIAFDDRPNRRTKDIEDINSICIHYPSIEREFIWTDHFDLYGGELEQQDIGHIVLGREMKKLVQQNQLLVDRLTRIMNKAINGETPFLPLMISDQIVETIEMKKKIITNLKLGFTGN